MAIVLPDRPNFGKTTLPNAISDSQTNIPGVDLTDFPAPVTDYDIVLFGKAFAQAADDATAELCKVTAKPGDLTAVREQQGTTKKAWLKDDKLQLVLTARPFDVIQAGLQALDAAVGFAHFGGFYREDLAAGVTDAIMARNETALGFLMAELVLGGGSLVRFGVRIPSVITAGSATFRVHKSGVAFPAAMDLVFTDATLYKSVTAVLGAQTFNNGDRLDVRVTTTGSLLPINMEILASMAVVVDYVAE